jgi:hypothetical protein
MADVFQAILDVAINPCVEEAFARRDELMTAFGRWSAIPGTAEGGVAGALRLRTYAQLSAIVSGVALGIILYRRSAPGYITFGFGGSWLGWLLSGRRDW